MNWKHGHVDNFNAPEEEINTPNITLEDNLEPYLNCGPALDSRRLNLVNLEMFCTEILYSVGLLLRVTFLFDWVGP